MFQIERKYRIASTALMQKLGLTNLYKDDDADVANIYIINDILGVLVSRIEKLERDVDEYVRNPIINVRFVEDNLR